MVLIGGSETIARVGLTVAALSSAYALGEAFIQSVHKSEKKREPLQFHNLAPSSPSALSTVQEGDDETADSSPQKSGNDAGSIAKDKPPPSWIKSIIRLHAIIKDEKSSSVTPLAAGVVLTILFRSLGELSMYRVTSGLEGTFLTRSNSRQTFEKLLTTFLLVGIPTVVVQHLAHWLASTLSSQIRRRLTDLLMTRLVLSPHNLCHPEELVDSQRLEALMGDINTASSLSVQIGAEKLKKFFDVLIQLGILVKQVGPVPPLAMLLYLWVTLRAVTKQKLRKLAFIKRVNGGEDVIRKLLSRIQRHRDDVAVWSGASAEKESIDKSLRRMETAKYQKDTFEFLNGVFSSLCSRVGSVALGFALIGGRAFNKSDNSVISYLWSGRVMLQLSNNLSSLIEDELIAREQTPHQSVSSKLASSCRRLNASLVELPNQLPPTDTLPFRVRKSNLCLNDVTGVAPDGAILFQSLSIELSPGGSLLVQGSKDSGKSALLRIMAGTWPAVMGEVSRPKLGVFCVPAKPYLLVEGSLKHQICYPDSDELIDQERLDTAIDVARIPHLFTVNGIARNGSGSVVMGEMDQQKLMFARLVYHRPKYALLDDCWSKLDPSHFCEILLFLKKELSCGVVVACSNTEGIKSPDFGFSFDLELMLPSAQAKKPPRHEIIVNRSS